MKPASTWSGSLGRLRGLHHDQGGQISLLGVLAAAALACLLLLVVNTGHSTSQKAQLQGCADATSISGAIWMARGLNVISMNNVAQTQLLAIAIIIKSVTRTVEIAVPIVEVQQAAAQACMGAPIIGVVCQGVYYYTTAELKLYLYPLRTMMQRITHIADPPDRELWQAMKALGLISGAVKYSFPGIAIAESARIAQANGADFGVILPHGSMLGVSLDPVLPVKEGTFYDLCDPTRRGSPTSFKRGYTPLMGYEEGKGPLEHFGEPVGETVFHDFVNWNTGARQIFGKLRQAYYGWICEGMAESFTYDRAVPLDECRSLGGTAEWIDSSYSSDWLDYRIPGIRTRRFEEGDPLLSEFHRGEDGITRLDCSDRPDGDLISSDPEVYRKVNEWTWAELVGHTEEGDPIYENRFRYEVKEYGFKRAMVETEEIPEDLTAGMDKDDFPKPYLLNRPEQTTEEIRDQLNYLGIVYREDSVAWGERVFLSPLGRHRLAYAQARVFNGVSFDLFTQDWRVKLVPAGMLEEVLSGGLLGHAGIVEAAIGSGVSPADSEEAMGPLNSAASSGGVLELLNNH